VNEIPKEGRSWGSDKVANLLFELVGDLKSEYKFERSVKIQQKKLLGNRFMLGVYKSRMGENRHEKLLDICRRMDMPETLFKAFSENLSDAEGVGFGFEANEKTMVYKVYLDFMDKWKKENRCGPDQRDPLLVILGFKWDVRDKRKEGMARYTWHPNLPIEEIHRRISDVFGKDRHRKPSEIATSLVDIVSRRISAQNILYLDVVDDKGRRRSFDMNLYGANFQLKEIYPLLQEALQHYSIPAQKFHPLYNTLRSMRFGHLSGGIGSGGDDFLTIYFGIESIRKASMATPQEPNTP
jgi:hypothetical protein